MSSNAFGCCLGMVFGCLLVIFLLILAVLGVIYLCSDTFREQSNQAIQSSWVEVKTGVEDTVNKVKE